MRDAPSALVACCFLQVDFKAGFMILITESVVARYLPRRCSRASFSLMMLSQCAGLWGWEAVWAIGR